MHRHPDSPFAAPAGALLPLQRRSSSKLLRMVNSEVSFVDWMDPAESIGRQSSGMQSSPLSRAASLAAAATSNSRLAEVSRLE